MRTLKLVIAYEGTRYAGWQRQPDAVTVQSLLEEALTPLDRGRVVRVAGACRTDAGVHARGQVASCQVRTTAIDAATIKRALNARLPRDVRVLEVSDVPPTFHARYGASAKTYVYRILNGPVCDPFIGAFVWHVIPSLDVPAMALALEAVRGCHDFKAFQAAGTRVTATVRTISVASVEQDAWAGLFDPGTRLDAPLDPDARLVTFVFRGDGFLRHMVRNLVGTAVEIGLGRWAPDRMREILERRDRRRAGPTAPPQGLVLEHVVYAGQTSGDVPTHPPADGPPAGRPKG